MKKILSLILALVLTTCSLSISVVGYAGTSIADKAMVIKNNESKTQSFSSDSGHFVTAYYKFTAPETTTYDFILTGWNYNYDKTVSASVQFCNADGSFDEHTNRRKGRYDEKYKIVVIVAALRAGQTYYIEANYNSLNTSYPDNLDLTLAVRNHQHQYVPYNDPKDKERRYQCEWCERILLVGHPDIPKLDAIYRKDLSISKVKLSKTVYTYDGKTKTPKVTVKNGNGDILVKDKNYTVKYPKNRKNVGKYKVKVSGAGRCTGTKSAYFVIRPKSTSITGITLSKNKLTVKWKKQSVQTSGYQIQYSTDSKFKNSKTIKVSGNKTTKKIIKNQKNKKYYVRIRTYKNVKVNNKTEKIYSSWSKTKKIVSK